MINEDISFTIPTSRIFNVKDYSNAYNILNEIFFMDFNKELGFKILMPKNQDLVKRISSFELNTESLDITFL